jgi:hypothetical protein
MLARRLRGLRVTGALQVPKILGRSCGVKHFKAKVKAVLQNSLIIILVGQKGR